MLMQTEGFPYDTTNAIAFDGTAGHLRRHGKPETRTILIVQTRSHPEEPVSHAPTARVCRLEVRLPPQATLRGKSESLGMHAAVGVLAGLALLGLIGAMVGAMLGAFCGAFLGLLSAERLSRFWWWA